MRCATFRHTPDSTWSVPTFPPLDSDRTLVVAFGGSGLLDDDGPVRELVAAYPTSHVIGCSTSGEFLDDVLGDDGLAVGVLQFERTHVAGAVTSVGGPDESFDAGAALVRGLDRDDLRAVLVLSDGHDVNGSELVAGMRANLPHDVVIAGGLAGDADRFERTWVLQGGAPAPRCIQAIGLSGAHVHVSHGCAGGWDPFGPIRRITKSRGNVLHELDGRPALSVYRAYLGEEAEGLPATALLFPLAVSLGDEYVVRTVLSIDDDAQTMTFAGDVPEGSHAQFMMATHDGLIEGAADSARRLRERFRCDGPQFTIAVSCVGRRLVLGERAEEELEAVAEGMPSGSDVLGFYSYGEIGPSAAGPSILHNQTMSLVSIRED